MPANDEDSSSCSSVWNVGHSCQLGVEFDVRLLGAPLQNVEGGVGVDAVDVHPGALRLFDDGVVVGDFGDGWVMLACLASPVGVTST